MHRTPLLAATLLFLAAAAHPTTRHYTGHRTTARPEPAHTVWDSVYTDSQAATAESAYKQNCAKCHGAALEGAQDGGPLAGPIFLANWNGLTLSDLSDKIRTTMPPDTPNTIPPSQVADLVALVLAQNHFPAGPSALKADAERLKDIKIVLGKP